VVHVDDLVELNPFEEAANRTAVFVCQKGRETKYPVPYTLWRRRKRARIGVDLALSEVGGLVKRANLYAQPVNEAEPTSPWITARQRALKALGKVIGESEYQARAGSYTGGLNGVHWVRILDKRPDGLVVIENLHDVGRIKVKRVQMAVEPDLVYPLLRGRDVMRWRATPSAHIIVSQDPNTRMAYDENWMKINLPQTYAFFKQFERELWTRKSQVVRDLMKKSAFYAMYAVANYTFAPFKVVWREQAAFLTTAVIGSVEGKPIIPDHKLMLVPFDNEEEAHYVCALLSSSIAQFVVKSYVVEVSTSTHVLENIRISKYDFANPLHQELAALSQRAHELAAKDEKEKLRDVEEEIDEKAAQLWGLTGEELREIKRSLEELR